MRLVLTRLSVRCSWAPPGGSCPHRAVYLPACLSASTGPRPGGSCPHWAVYLPACLSAAPGPHPVVSCPHGAGRRPGTRPCSTAGWYQPDTETMSQDFKISQQQADMQTWKHLEFRWQTKPDAIEASTLYSKYRNLVLHLMYTRSVRF